MHGLGDPVKFDRDRCGFFDLDALDLYAHVQCRRRLDRRVSVPGWPRLGQANSFVADAWTSLQSRMVRFGSSSRRPMWSVRGSRGPKGPPRCITAPRAFCSLRHRAGERCPMRMWKTCRHFWRVILICGCAHCELQCARLEHGLEVNWARCLRRWTCVHLLLVSWSPSTSLLLFTRRLQAKPRARLASSTRAWFYLVKRSVRLARAPHTRIVVEECRYLAP